jgi:transcriptional regulator with XRE-family HTH domain
MEFNEKLMHLRKQKGWSQEELGFQINTTRQTISKWELGDTTPEMSKLIQLSELFEVSLDELMTGMTFNDKVAIKNRYPIFEYVSKITLFRLPLIHINTGYGFRRAKGIIAIGNVATGIFAFGGVGFGLVSLSGLSTGMLALGGFSIGALSFGGLAIGLVSFGAVSIGYHAIGAVALAKEVAIGKVAYGNLAVGEFPEGSLMYNYTDSTLNEVQSKISELYPLSKSWINWILDKTILK